VNPSRPLDQIPSLDQIAKILHQEDVVGGVVFNPKHETKGQDSDVNEPAKDPHLPSPRHLRREKGRGSHTSDGRRRRQGEGAHKIGRSVIDSSGETNL
jgi:hypothetical protein